MTPEERQEINEQLDVEAERTAQESAARTAQSMAQSGIEERIQNPQFLEEYTDPDADSAAFDWVEAEFGPLFSKAHVLGYRSEDYEREAKWLDMNKAERMIRERDPGRILKEHPDVLAVMQGERYHPEADRYDSLRNPVSQEQRRVQRDGAEVVTQRKSLAVGGTGSDNLTTATAEQRTVRNEQEESSSTRKKIRSIFS